MLGNKSMCNFYGLKLTFFSQTEKTHKNRHNIITSPNNSFWSTHIVYNSRFAWDNISSIECSSMYKHSWLMLNSHNSIDHCALKTTRYFNCRKVKEVSKTILLADNKFYCYSAFSVLTLYLVVFLCKVCMVDLQIRNQLKHTMHPLVFFLLLCHLLFQVLDQVFAYQLGRQTWNIWFKSPSDC